MCISRGKIQRRMTLNSNSKNDMSLPTILPKASCRMGIADRGGGRAIRIPNMAAWSEGPLLAAPCIFLAMVSYLIRSTDLFDGEIRHRLQLMRYAFRFRR